MPLTSNSPSNILVDIRNPVPVFVKIGVKIVRLAVAPMPVKNTRFPPYLNLKPNIDIFFMF